MNAMRATDVIRHLIQQGMPLVPVDMRGWAMLPKDLLRACDIIDYVGAMRGLNMSSDRMAELVEKALIAWRAFDSCVLHGEDNGGEEGDDEETDVRLASSPDLLKTARGK